MAQAKRNSFIRWLILLVLIVALGYVAKSYFFTASPAPQYITVKAAVGDIEDTVLASGTFEAIEQVSVGAQVSGRVVKLHVKLNDQVKAGDLVAEIDSMTQQNSCKKAQAALAVVEANLASEQANLAQLKLEYDRQQKLRKTDASSKADFEKAQAGYKMSLAKIRALQAQIEQSKVDVRIAEVNLGYTRITSPIDGTVVAIVTKEGQTVNANQTAPTIIKVANLERMTVKAEISEADVTRTKAGQRVFFKILGEPDRRYDAVLKEIEPAPESIAKETLSSTTSSTTAIYYNGLFDVDNAEQKFRIDMTAEVNIVRDEAKGAIVVPSSALLSRGAGKYIVRILKTDGAIEDRPVKVGINNKVSAQIIEGLKEGEEIIMGDSALNAGSSSGFRSRGPMGM